MPPCASDGDQQRRGRRRASRALLLCLPRVLLSLALLVPLPLVAVGSTFRGGARGRPIRVAGTISQSRAGAYLRQAGNRGRGGTRARTRYSVFNQLQYFQGPVLVAPARVYLIYYGNWTNGTAAKNDSAQNLFRSFLNSINATSPSGVGSVADWWKINSLFSQKDGQYVTNQVSLGGEGYDWYSQGKVLTDDSTLIYRVVQRQFDLKNLTPSSSAMYAVLTSPDVMAGTAGDGFCSSYCGWHDVNNYTVAKTKASMPIYYAFVGDPATQCMAACASGGLSVNGNTAIDYMVDTLAHELAEMATDPDTTSGWLTDSGNYGLENADLCRRDYLGTKSVRTTGGSYLWNLAGLNGSRFLIQSIYNPVRGDCTMSP